MGARGQITPSKDSHAHCLFVIVKEVADPAEANTQRRVTLHESAESRPGKEETERR